MKRQILMLVALVAVMAGCSSSTQADGASRQSVSMYVDVKEITLSDGTRCAVTVPTGYAAGAGISCGWK